MIVFDLQSLIILFVHSKYKIIFGAVNCSDIAPFKAIALNLF